MNPDGVIDAHDAQLAHDSLAALGQHCADPATHLSAPDHTTAHDAGPHDGGH